MPEIRFVIDDAGQCRTQRAVLSAFAASLAQDISASVVWSSDVHAVRHWEDVPPESARRLDLRLQALEPAAGRVTVFLPGHTIPAAIAPWHASGEALSTSRFTTVADLDIFVADNDAAELRAFHAFIDSHADYEAISRYDGFTSGELPDWLSRGGLVSALSFTQRPWYSALASSRVEWLRWVRMALEQGVLTMAMVEEDLRQGRVRPSLLEDVSRPLDDIALPDLTLDALFVVPECRPSDKQKSLLHSAELQKRTLDFVQRNSKRKSQKQWQRHGIWGRLRRVPKGLAKRLLKFCRRCVHKAYAGYAMSLRPLVKRLSQRNGTAK